MSNSYKKIPKLILSCSLGATLLFSSAYAVEDGMAISNDEVIKNKVELKDPTLINQSSIKLEGGIEITGDDQLITLSIRDSDTRQVLRMLADKAGLNIIFHNSVNGNVTLDLVNVSLNKAFEYILSVNNLNYLLDGDTLFIASAGGFSEIGIKKQQMTPIPIKHLDASKVATFLNNNIFGLNKPGLSNEQIVITNPRKNEVLIFGTDKDVKIAKDVISEIDTKPETKEFEVNHMTSSQMANLLCSNVFGNADAGSDAEPDGTGGGNLACSGSGSVSAGNMSSLEEISYRVIEFPDLSKIVISGATKEQLAMVSDFIQNTDKKQPQIYLEMSIVELSESGSKALSSTWAYYDGKFSIDGGYADSANPESTWDGTTGTLSNVTRTKIPDPLGLDGDMEGTAIPGGYLWSGSDTLGESYTPNYVKTIAQNISFLVSNSKGRTLANPKLIATNNRTSTVELTADYVETIETTVETTTAGNTKTTEITLSDAGITIEITPRIAPNGFITMDIKPEYSTIKEQVYTDTDNLIATLLNKRNIQLENVRVKDGETIIIGGLNQEVETKTQKKIPVLGDLPMLGTFFRSTTRTTGKSELIIMITPQVINDDGNGEASSV